jgi:hypothetical protein
VPINIGTFLERFFVRLPDPDSTRAAVTSDYVTLALTRSVRYRADDQYRPKNIRKEFVIGFIASAKGIVSNSLQHMRYCTIDAQVQRLKWCRKKEAQ